MKDVEVIFSTHRSNVSLQVIFIVKTSNPMVFLSDFHLIIPRGPSSFLNTGYIHIIVLLLLLLLLYLGKTRI